MKWVKAAVGKQVKLIPVDDVLYFQSDTKYTRVVLAQRRSADPHAAQGPPGGARSGQVLAGASRHDRQSRRGVRACCAKTPSASSSCSRTGRRSCRSRGSSRICSSRCRARACAGAAASGVEQFGESIAPPRRTRVESRAMQPVAIFRFSPTENPGPFGAWLDAAGNSRGSSSRSTRACPFPSSPSGYSGIGMMGGPMSVNDKLPWVEPLCALVRDAIVRRHAGHRALPRRPADGQGARRARRAHARSRRSAGSTSTSCDRGARREWFGGLPRFPAFEWHYDAFDLPPMATRILTNDVAVNQGFVIDDRHVGFQCHIEMTRELVRNVVPRWAPTSCRRGRARTSRAPPTSRAISTGASAALGEVADGVYARWAQGSHRSLRRR